MLACFWGGVDVGGGDDAEVPCCRAEESEPENVPTWEAAEAAKKDLGVDSWCSLNREKMTSTDWSRLRHLSRLTVRPSCTVLSSHYHYYVRTGADKHVGSCVCAVWVPVDLKGRHGHCCAKVVSGMGALEKATCRSTVEGGSLVYAFKWWCHSLHEGEIMFVFGNSANWDPIVEWFNEKRSMDTIETKVSDGKAHSLLTTDRYDGKTAVHMVGPYFNVESVNWTSVEVVEMSFDNVCFAAYLDWGRYHWRFGRSESTECHGSMCLTSVKGRSFDNVVVEGPPGCTKMELAHFEYREKCICDEASASTDEHTYRHNYECTK